MFTVINRWGFHSVQSFTNAKSAQVYADRLNRLSNQGWRVVEIFTGR